jgi:NAD(P)-dependent dehydrogenase (short-subunit alcohol dehydrogenase family)
MASRDSAGLPPAQVAVYSPRYGRKAVPRSQEGSPRVDLTYYRNWSLEKDTVGYDVWHAYQQSKLGNILLAKKFHKRYPKIETASCHPGIVYTEMGKHLYTRWFDVVKDYVLDLPFIISTEGLWFPVKSAAQGASTTITAASLPTNQLVNGGLYKDCVLSQESVSAKNMDDATALFDWCEELTRHHQ